MTEPLAPLTIMLLQQGIAYVAILCVCVWYVYPWLRSKEEFVAVPIALMPFLFRFIGNANMVPGVVGPDYPLHTAWTVVIGDTLCPLLALVALGLYRHRSRWATLAAWVTALQSLLYSSYFAAMLDIELVVENLHAHWYIAAIFVPVLVVDTFLIMVLLLSYRQPRAATA